MLAFVSVSQKQQFQNLTPHHPPTLKAVPTAEESLRDFSSLKRLFVALNFNIYSS